MSVRHSPALRAGLGLVFAFQAGGCVGLETVRALPTDAGLRAEYRASPDEIAAFVPGALQELDHAVEVYEVTDSGTHIVMGSQSPGPFLNGRFTRVLLRAGADRRTSELRVVARSRYLLDASGRATRLEPRLLGIIDETLGADRIAPFSGLTVRGTPAGGGTEVRGPVDAAATDVPTLIPEGSDPTPVRLDELLDASVLRGSYSYAGEGALYGTLLGLVALLVADPQCSPGGCTSWTPIAWSGGGALAGFLLGSAIRTEVWSPADFGSAPGRTGS